MASALPTLLLVMGLADYDNRSSSKVLCLPFYKEGLYQVLFGVDNPFQPWFWIDVKDTTPYLSTLPEKDIPDASVGATSKYEEVNVMTLPAELNITMKGSMSIRRVTLEELAEECQLKPFKVQSWEGLYASEVVLLTHYHSIFRRADNPKSEPMLLPGVQGPFDKINILKPGE